MTQPAPLAMASKSLMGKVWALTKPYWLSEERWVARGLLLAVVSLTLFQIYLSVQLNQWSNDFYNAVQEKRAEDFWALIKYFSFLASVFIASAGYNLYLNLNLQIRWRRWLTTNYLDDWLGQRIYYRMELKNYGTDNVDQRIQEDLRDFASLTLSLTLDLLGNIVTLVAFSTILWKLSGAFSLEILGTTVAIPGYMMWVALIYAVIGSWLTHRIARPLSGLNFNQQRFEADFRYSLVRLRENAEGIAAYAGEQDEKRALLARFSNVWGNWWQLMKYRKSLQWFQSGYGQIAIIFPYLVVAPRFFSGAIQFGQIFQTASAFGHVQGALSWLVDTYDRIALWHATVLRLTTFHHAIEQASAAASSHQGIALTSGSTDEFDLSAVQVNLPDGRALLSAAGVSLRAHENALLTGPSGTGKSTLFRAIAGIWPFGTGRITVPPRARGMFLPQKPYLPLGTLREAVAYPAATMGFSDAQIRTALLDVRLEDLIAHLDEAGNWAQRLSPGEQQRLAFARALLNQPGWLFLDEATSALDEDTERRLYQLLSERLPQTTLISIAHRASVSAYHRRHLALQREGTGPAQLADAVS